MPLFNPSGAGSWELIASTTILADAASITVSSIPAAYTHFHLVLVHAHADSQRTIYLQLNGTGGTGTDVTNYPGIVPQGITTFDIAQRGAGDDAVATTNTTGINLGNPARVSAGYTWVALAAVISTIAVVSSASNFESGTHLELWGCRT